MKKVLSAEEMREVDRLTTEEYGIPSLILMENAAHAAARVITEKLGGSMRGKSILILCGRGNNGGDGAAIARILAGEGARVDAVLFGKAEETTGDAAVNFQICRKLAGAGKTIGENGHQDIHRDSPLSANNGVVAFYEVSSRSDFDELLFGRFDRRWNAVVDAVFGTGLTRPLEGWLGDVIRRMNVLRETRRNRFGTGEMMFAIDLPSGLVADTSEPLGTVIEADFTVTFTAPKAANVLPPASNFNGELFVVEIGSPQELINRSPSRLFLAEKQDAKKWLDKTAFVGSSYKNRRGHALLVAGAENFAGAAVLAGNAAIRSGCGLVTIATPESSRTAIASRVVPEVMTRGVAETEGGAVAEEAFDEINSFVEKKADVVAIGSGLSSSEESTRRLVRRVVEQRQTPVVIDADGLNALAPWNVRGSNELPLILTPHGGEFLKLIGTDDKSVMKDRVAAGRDFAVRHHVILVMKGERTLIAAPDGRVVINPTGNPGLGKAGNGDTLAGIIAGFIAQAAQMKIDIFETTVAAVYLGGLAGDIAAAKFGKRFMTASDVKDCLCGAFAEVEKV